MTIRQVKILRYVSYYTRSEVIEVEDEGVKMTPSQIIEEIVGDEHDIIWEDNEDEEYDDVYFIDGKSYDEDGNIVNM